MITTMQFEFTIRDGVGGVVRTKNGAELKMTKVDQKFSAHRLHMFAQELLGEVFLNIFLSV